MDIHSELQSQYLFFMSAGNLYVMRFYNSGMLLQLKVLIVMLNVSLEIYDNRNRDFNNNTLLL